MVRLLVLLLLQSDSLHGCMDGLVSPAQNEEGEKGQKEKAAASADANDTGDAGAVADSEHDAETDVRTAGADRHDADAEAVAKSATKKPRGLINHGNTCYFNVIVQVIRPLRNQCLSMFIIWNRCADVFEGRIVPPAFKMCETKHVRFGLLRNPNQKAHRACNNP